MRDELEQAFDDVEISQSDYEQLKGLDNSLWTTSQLIKVVICTSAIASMSNCILVLYVY